MFPNESESPKRPQLVEGVVPVALSTTSLQNLMSRGADTVKHCHTHSYQQQAAQTSSNYDSPTTAPPPASPECSGARSSAGGCLAGRVSSPIWRQGMQPCPSTPGQTLAAAAPLPAVCTAHTRTHELSLHHCLCKFIHFVAFTSYRISARRAHYDTISQRSHLSTTDLFAVLEMAALVV